MKMMASSLLIIFFFLSACANDSDLDLQDPLKKQFVEIVLQKSPDPAALAGIIHAGMNDAPEVWSTYPAYALIKKNRLEVLKETIGIIDVNAADKNGETALFFAVKAGNAAIVDWLLANGADFTRHNSQGLTALMIAEKTRSADDKIVSLLRESTAGNEALEKKLEAALGDPKSPAAAIRSIIDEGLNKYPAVWRGKSVFTLLEKGRYDVLGKMVNVVSFTAVNGEGETPLVWAVRNQNLKAVKWLAAVKGNLLLESTREAALKAAMESIFSAPDNSEIAKRFEYVKAICGLRGEYGPGEAAQFAVFYLLCAPPAGAVNSEEKSQRMNALIATMKENGKLFDRGEINGYFAAADAILPSLGTHSKIESRIAFFLKMAYGLGNDALIRHLLVSDMSSWWKEPDDTVHDYLLDCIAKRNTGMVDFILRYDQIHYENRLNEALNGLIFHDSAPKPEETEAYKAMAASLLLHGADPNYIPSPCTDFPKEFDILDLPIDEAVREGKEDSCSEETILYTAVAMSRLDLAEVLIEFGGDPERGRSEYSTQFAPPGDDEFRTLVVPNFSFQSVDELARKDGKNEFVEKTQKYVHEPALRSEDFIALRRALLEKNYSMIRYFTPSSYSLKPGMTAADPQGFLYRADFKSYCPRDRDLFRKAFFETGGDSDAKGLSDEAITYYKKALENAAPNTEGISAIDNLLNADLETWESRETGDPRAGEIAFNIASAYARIGRNDESLQWQTAAIRLNAANKSRELIVPAPEETAVRYIVPPGGLNMRDAPSTKGKAIALIPFDDPVTVLEETGDAVTIQDKTGRWTKVQWKDKTGWVFGGHLRE